MGNLLGVDNRHQAVHPVGVDTRHHNGTTMTSTRLDLLQGTLDLLILRTLTGDPRHGWAISERIQQLSKDVLRVNQGSLYPALHRLEQQGWIVSDWGVSELGRR